MGVIKWLLLQGGVNRRPLRLYIKDKWIPRSRGVAREGSWALPSIRVTILLIGILVPVISNAYKISGNFIVTENYFDFTKSIVSGKCTGRIPYPVLTNDDQELTIQINDEIFDFVELYAICNQREEDNFSVNFDMPSSGVENYFSVRWITKKDGKIYRIDSLNFNTNTDDILTADDVFNSLSSALLGELVKLSEGHLPAHFTWENFLDKIGKRDIQYYIKNKEWYIVFNATPQLDKVVDVKIPEYFLQQE